MKKLHIYVAMSTVVFLGGGIIALTHMWLSSKNTSRDVVATKSVVEPKIEVPQYLNHKTKCFQCEKQLLSDVGDDGVWFAQPSKLYDAEQDGIIQANNQSGGYMGKTVMFYQAL